jgi:imidazolonepropionase-like amidohydrolase
MSDRIVFTNACVFDGVSEALLTGQTVVVESSEITYVGEHIETRPNDRLIDVGARTLMPGLIDAHFHCNSPNFDIAGLDRMPPSHMAQFAAAFLEGMLQQGFTTVRDAGGADIGLARAIDDGLIEGPRLFVAGKALSQTGGHGDMRTPGQVSPCSCAYIGALSVVVDGVDEMRRCVRDAFHHGASHVKIFVSGGVLSPSDPIWMDQFHESEIAAAVEEAQTRRGYVMAHAHTANAAVRCARNGVRSIEHGTMLDAEAANFVADHEAFVVPTLSVISALKRDDSGLPAEAKAKLEQISDQAMKSIEYCVSAGVELGFGTDYFGALHGNETQELVERAKVQTSAQVLMSATSINAALIKQNGSLGVIKTGAKADLIVVTGDPLQDISVLRDKTNLDVIMKGGRMYKNKLSEASNA